MNRTLLVRTLEALSAPLGCTFRSAPDGALLHLAGAAPTLWLSPPELLRVEGIKKGRESYSIKLHLLYIPESKDPTRLTEQQGEMEELLLELMARLSETPQVISIEEISITPSNSPLTPRGEALLRLEAEVITWF